METREKVNTDKPASLGAAEETQATVSPTDRERQQRSRPESMTSGSATKDPRGEQAQADIDDDDGETDADASDTPTRSGSERTANDNDRPSAERPASAESLVEPNRARDYRTRWTSIQAVFVDQPKDAVEKADALVEEVVHDLTDAFGRERSDLEQQWSSGEQVSTEQLRVALQRYRTFFEQLLSA
ncbi:MAG: hypothetical protein JO343_09090 [Candidatus Eremiobacteraeota bacterium]|nr:hypothetical protein [Candidatus Eremiobacteraeota bacterium]MBV8669934.1 hypothetical protein [Candidatus Eremiobacteraeota bacterium]